MTLPVIQKYNLFGNQNFFDRARILYWDTRTSNDPQALEKFQREISGEMLTVEDLKILLRESSWDLMYIPFILNGFKIFKPRIDTRDIAQRTILETFIYGTFWQIFNAIMKRQLSISCKSSISIPLDIAMQNPTRFIFEKLVHNVGADNENMSVLIEVPDLIKCCISENIIFDERFCDLLGIYINPKNPNLKKPNVIELRFLAIAQVLWFYYPERNKSQIYEDDLWNQIGFKPYAKSSALDKLSIIDPSGLKRNRGRGNKSKSKALNSGVFTREIPKIWISEGSQRKIDLKKALILISEMSKALKTLKNFTSIEVTNHDLFGVYFKDAHSVVKAIINKAVQINLKEYLELEQGFDPKILLGVDPIILQKLPNQIKKFRFKS